MGRSRDEAERLAERFVHASPEEGDEIVADLDKREPFIVRSDDDSTEK